MAADLNNTTFIWNFRNMIAYPTKEQHQNVVFMVNWEYTGTYIDSSTEKDYKVMRNGTTEINSTNIQNFIPFEELTKNDVISWVESSTDIGQIRQDIVNKINEQINPPPPSIVILNPPFNN